MLDFSRGAKGQTHLSIRLIQRARVWFALPFLLLAVSLHLSSETKKHFTVTGCWRLFPPHVLVACCTVSRPITEMHFIGISLLVGLRAAAQHQTHPAETARFIENIPLHVVVFTLSPTFLKGTYYAHFQVHISIRVWTRTCLHALRFKNLACFNPLSETHSFRSDWSEQVVRFTSLTVRSIQKVFHTHFQPVN